MQQYLPLELPEYLVQQILLGMCSVLGRGDKMLSQVWSLPSTSLQCIERD